jgi:hypothetical protein
MAAVPSGLPYGLHPPFTKKKKKKKKKGLNVIGLLYIYDVTVLFVLMVVVALIVLAGARDLLCVGPPS